MRGVTCRAPNCTVSPIATSKLMMRPVILSRPENSALVLGIFCDGGSAMTWSPGCGEVSAGCGGAPRGGGRWPGGRPLSAGWLGEFDPAPPDGGGNGCDCTAPDGATRPLPGGG